MTRKKLSLAYISDDTVRKATFKHRKGALTKKLDELKILCDVDACAVIFNPFNSSPEPEVWPSNSGVYDVVQKFEMLTETEKAYRSVSHKEFLIQNIAKVEKQNQKLSDDNKEKFMRELMFACLGGHMGDLDMNDNARRDLCEFIDRYLMNLFHHKYVTLNNPHFEIGESSSTNMAPTAMSEVGSSTFWNAPIFNSPQLTNEIHPIISSNQGSEHIDSFASNILPMSDQEDYTPVMNQEEVYYPDQNQNQQGWFVEEMMKHSEQTGFPWMK